MPTDLLEPITGLSIANLEKANALPEDVRTGKTFYSGSKTLQTGTLLVPIMPKMILYTGIAWDPNQLGKLSYYENYELKDERTYSRGDLASWQYFHFVRIALVSNRIDIYSNATRVFNMQNQNSYSDGYNGFKGNGSPLYQVGWGAFHSTPFMATFLVQE